MNPKYLLSRFTPLNIFENIFVLAEIFMKVVFFSKKLPETRVQKSHATVPLMLGKASIGRGLHLHKKMEKAACLVRAPGAYIEASQG